MNAHKRLVASFAIVAVAGSAHAADIPVCTDAQLLGLAPKSDEVAAHRGFSVPTLTHAYGSMSQTEYWGIKITMRIDESGSVQCYRLSNGWEEGIPVPLNKTRLELIESMRQWRYRPFVRSDKPLVAIVIENVAEEEAPRVRVPLPGVPLEKVHVRLERTACYGACPIYSVDVYGDGRVIYRGDQYVDVTGQHTYRIPQPQVAALVESVRAKDIWSLRKRYRGLITDHPLYRLTLDFGDQSHSLEDYVGNMVGMPQSVADFEDEIDEVSGASGWVNLGSQAVEQLAAARFDFSSPAGADLLRRAVANRGAHDNAAMLRAIELGAPTEGLIGAALLHNRAELIDALIKRGALTTNGAPDQRKIDAAFAAAITGGRLAPVQKIWSVSGSAPHPSLTFERAPVTLLLQRRYDDQGWEGPAVAKWLAEQGCDLNASDDKGKTLLYIAADADDVQFVRYLLGQGVDPSARALGTAEDEDIAMLLLEAGADVSLMSDHGKQFRRYAEYKHWGRVIAWLDAH
jgi:hypothetical protein